MSSSPASNSVSSSVIPPNLSTSSQVEFPFTFLHAELVRHFRERDIEIKRHKEEWAATVKKSDFSEVLLQNGANLNKLIFSQENAETRLEAIGHRVGYLLVERVAKDIPRLTNELETVKFICKEFWSTVFGKPADNLRTNHKGVYIIQDNKFNALVPFSEGSQFLVEALIFLALPCGAIRGALSNLGINAIVTSEVEVLPRVKFNIQLNK